MTLQRPDSYSGPAVTPCGKPTEGGWINLPAGWHPGDPPDPVVLARTLASGSDPDSTGSPADGPPLLTPALALLVLMAGLVAIRRRRRTGTRRDGAGPDAPARGDAHAHGDEGNRDRDRTRPSHRDTTPVRTPRYRPTGKPIVVTLGRSPSRPPPTPVRLPPHVAAALSRARRPGVPGGKDADGEGSRPPPDDGAGSARGPERPEVGAGDRPPADGAGRRRGRTGNSWLIGD